MKPNYDRAPVMHLTPEAWQDVRTLFEAALRRDPEERGGFLDSACAGKPDLRAHVVALLRAWNEDTATFDDRAPAGATPVASPDGAAGLPGGQMIGPYIVRHELGRGGMGIVYLADDARLARRVALKALHPAVTNGTEQRERLRQEARIAAALSHPGIAIVYALEEIDSCLYVASEFVPGRTLRTMLQDGPLSAALVIDIATQVARVLTAAHAQSVVHRDLKPENIMVTPAGVVKVLDFGLARSESLRSLRLTHTGTVVGTPAYMAPEQLLGEKVDFRTDLFAFGVLVYEMASGSNPFEASTLGATVEKILRHEPGPLSQRCNVPAALEQIVATCMCKAAPQRYRSTETLLAELERVQREMAAGGERAKGQPRVESVVASRGQPILTPRWWWEFHQIVMSVIYVLIMYPAWRVRPWLPQPWGTAFLFTVLACAAAATSLRLNLLFTARVYPSELSTQRARSLPWTRACDIGFAGSLLVGALGIGSAHPEVGTLLVTVSIVSAVASLIIEPSTTRAAFRRRSGGAVRIQTKLPR